MTAPDDPLEDSPFDCMVGQDTHLRECAIDGMFGAGPSGTVIGLLLAATLLTSLYIAGDRDVVVPSIVTILAGTALVPLLPDQYVSLAYTTVVIGITAAGLAAARAYLIRGQF